MSTTGNSPFVNRPMVLNPTPGVPEPRLINENQFATPFSSMLPDKLPEEMLRPGEIVVELDSEKHFTYFKEEVDVFSGKKRRFECTGVSGNDKYLWKGGPGFDEHSPDDDEGDRLRSRFQLRRNSPGTIYPQDVRDTLSQFDIPGDMIAVNLEDGYGRLIDGLSLSHHHPLWHKLKFFAASRSGDALPFVIGVPRKTKEVVFKTQAQRALWIFWMARLVEHCAEEGPRHCRPIMNVHCLPKAAEIVAEGHVPTGLPGALDLHAQRDGQARADRFGNPAVYAWTGYMKPEHFNPENDYGSPILNAATR